MLHALSMVPSLAAALLGLLTPENVHFTRNPLTDPTFVERWCAGQAEITRFELSQDRYGDNHGGYAVQIFVTEDFLPERHVKADDPDRQRSGAWPVLKLNFTKNFTTGVYPYSIMTSVFTPIEAPLHPHTLKTSTTVQEWCGHTFLQVNLAQPGYRVRGYSYFQSEGDTDDTLPATWLEDELWTRIRLDPDQIPTGEVRLLPSAEHLRLRHHAPTVQRATIARSQAEAGLRTLLVTYLQEDRTLAIRFQADAPHAIEGWTETIRGRTTEARRTHRRWLAYWQHNGIDDLPLRDSLGLPRE